MKTVIRNAAGQPFSKWKPADKFDWWFGMHRMDFWAHVDYEHEFDSERKWRFDFAWPTEKVAVEIDGFGYGHQAQQRIAQNNEKRNAALAQGWRVLVFDTRALGSKAAVEAAVELTCEVLCEEV